MGLLVMMGASSVVVAIAIILSKYTPRSAKDSTVILSITYLIVVWIGLWLDSEPEDSGFGYAILSLAFVTPTIWGVFSVAARSRRE